MYWLHPKEDKVFLCVGFSSDKSCLSASRIQGGGTQLVQQIDVRAFGSPLTLPQVREVGFLTFGLSMAGLSVEMSKR